MSLIIHITGRARRSRAALTLLVSIVLILFATVPSSRAVHASSRVQIPQAQPVADRRMTVLFFDLSSMAAEDVRRATNSAGDFINAATSGDLVSVVTLDSRLRVASDFTSDADVLHAVLADVRNGVQNSATLTPQPAAGADPRLSALKTLCQTLAPLQQRKALMYFSAGIARPDAADQASLNEATNSCRRANVLIYPVDARGLAAANSPATPGGVGLFRGNAGAK